MTAFEIILWALLILAPFYLARSPRTGSGVHLIKCKLFHRREWLRIPWGIHTYECECKRCLRTWVETE